GLAEETALIQRTLGLAAAAPPGDKVSVRNAWNHVPALPRLDFTPAAPNSPVPNTPPAAGSAEAAAPAAENAPIPTTARRRARTTRPVAPTGGLDLSALLAN